MIFKFGNYNVDIDTDATRKYYTEKTIENACECSGYINFRKFAENCDVIIKNSFADFGIDIMKKDI